jgi:hypothetical protein
MLVATRKLPLIGHFKRSKTTTYQAKAVFTGNNGSTKEIITLALIPTMAASVGQTWELK